MALRRTDQSPEEVDADPAERMDQIEEAHRPPEPQLLDTCVLQNLDWVDRTLAQHDGRVRWDDEAVAALVRRYGQELADDLLDLGTLYKRFEHDGGYPWLVCDTAVEEAGLLGGVKGKSVQGLISFLSTHQGDWSADAYPGVAHGRLLARRPGRVSPLILRALGVASLDEISAAGGPLAFLPDRGDRLVATHAIVANIPVIVTTDLRTFWVQRGRLAGLGVTVLRPSELLELYIPYWEAREVEFERRRAAARTRSTSNARD